MISIRVALWLLVCAVPVARADTCQDLDALSWMAGQWSSAAGNVVTTEQWTRVSPDTAEGVGEVRRADNGELRSRETLRLVAMSGEIYYLAKVAHNALPVAFRLTECSASSAQFENPEHDFPRRIGYRLSAEGMLIADVRGENDQGFVIEFESVVPPRSRRIALSFDDAPRTGTERFTGMQRTRALIEALREAEVPPVIWFSTTGRIDLEGSARMRLYAAAGHHVGNHSKTHQRIDVLGVEGYLDDIRQAHEMLQHLPTFVPFYRYPFLDEGRDVETRDALRAALAEMGYRNGYVTVDNYDFYMDSLLQQALRQGRPVDWDKLGELYVDVMIQAVRFYDAIAEQHLDHEPVHVLLMHENDLAALYIGELVAALRAAGWELVDAVSAYDDPIAFIQPDTLFNGQGRIAAIAAEAGTPRRELVHPLEDTGALEALFSERGVFGSPGRVPGTE